MPDESKDAAYAAWLHSELNGLSRNRARRGQAGEAKASPVKQPIQQQTPRRDKRGRAKFDDSDDDGISIDEVELEDEDTDDDTEDDGVPCPGAHQVGKANQEGVLKRKKSDPPKGDNVTSSKQPVKNTWTHVGSEAHGRGPTAAQSTPRTNQSATPTVDHHSHKKPKFDHARSDKKHGNASDTTIPNTERPPKSKDPDVGASKTIKTSRTDNMGTNPGQIAASSAAPRVKVGSAEDILRKANLLKAKAAAQDDLRREKSLSGKGKRDDDSRLHSGKDGQEKEKKRRPPGHTEERTKVKPGRPPKSFSKLRESDSVPQGMSAKLAPDDRAASLPAPGSSTVRGVQTPRASQQAATSKSFSSAPGAQKVSQPPPGAVATVATATSAPRTIPSSKPAHTAAARQPHPDRMADKHPEKNDKGAERASHHMEKATDKPCRADKHEKGTEKQMDKPRDKSKRAVEKRKRVSEKTPKPAAQADKASKAAAEHSEIATKPTVGVQHPLSSTEPTMPTQVLSSATIPVPVAVRVTPSIPAGAAAVATIDPVCAPPSARIVRTPSPVPGQAEKFEASDKFEVTPRMGQTLHQQLPASSLTIKHEAVLKPVPSGKPAGSVNTGLKVPGSSINLDTTPKRITTSMAVPATKQATPAVQSDVNLQPFQSVSAAVPAPESPSRRRKAQLNAPVHTTLSALTTPVANEAKSGILQPVASAVAGRVTSMGGVRDGDAERDADLRADKLVVDSQGLLNLAKQMSEVNKECSKRHKLRPCHEGRVKCFFSGHIYGIWLPTELLATRKSLAEALDNIYSPAACGTGDELNVVFQYLNGTKHSFLGLKKGSSQDPAVRKASLWGQPQLDRLARVYIQPASVPMTS